MFFNRSTIVFIECYTFKLIVMLILIPDFVTPGMWFWSLTFRVETCTVVMRSSCWKMLSNVGVSCRLSREILSHWITARKLSLWFPFCACVMTTCCSQRKIICSVVSLFFLRLLVPWIGIPRHRAVGMERKGDLTAYLPVKQYV